MSTNQTPLRIAIFTHDAYGIGHVRRCLRIITALAERAPESAILLITGSPAVDMFKSLPPNADYVKIPTILTSGAFAARPPTLPIGLAELGHLRQHLIREITGAFAPDIMLVDNFPLGTQAELLPTLQQLRRDGGRAVLGLRDIVDPPEHLRRDWHRRGIYEVVERYYDRVLIYGVPEVLDAADAYGLPPPIVAKLNYCGYVTEGSPEVRDASEVRAELGFDGPFVLATVGGGADGFPVLLTFIKSLGRLPGVSALITTGPFMSPSDRAELEEQVAGRPGTIIREHVRDIQTYMAAADAVVAMGGYNTAAELLAVRARAIVVPRTWRAGEHAEQGRTGADPEQLLRARALARAGLVELVEPEQLEPEHLAERLRTLLARPRFASAPPDLGGLRRVAEHLLSLKCKDEGAACVC
jgi:predicted glycosyltransferase